MNTRTLSFLLPRPFIEHRNGHLPSFQKSTYLESMELESVLDVIPATRCQRPIRIGHADHSLYPQRYSSRRKDLAVEERLQGVQKTGGSFKPKAQARNALEILSDEAI
jgi:hypothetical protein